MRDKMERSEIYFPLALRPEIINSNHNESIGENFKIQVSEYHNFHPSLEKVFLMCLLCPILLFATEVNPWISDRTSWKPYRLTRINKFRNCPFIFFLIFNLIRHVRLSDISRLFWHCENTISGYHWPNQCYFITISPSPFRL